MNKIGKRIKLSEEKYATIEKIFDYNGFRCIVILNEIKLPQRFNFLTTKWRCGYCGVKKEHPLYKREYNEIDNLVFAHGGLTFSNFGDGKVLPRNHTWWIGFDCHHHMDNINNWTFKRVKKEVKELAEQMVTKNLILAGLE